MVDALSLMKDISDQQHAVLEELRSSTQEQGEAIAALKVQVKLQWGLSTAELMLIASMFAKHLFPKFFG